MYLCGESFPIDSEHKTDYYSKKERRVELVFYEKNKPPEIKKPENKKEKITKNQCVNVIFCDNQFLCSTN